MSDGSLVALDDRLLFGDGVPRPGEPASLAASRCSACDRHEFPVRASCPVCHGATVEVALSTEAVAEGFTTVSSAPPGGLLDVPYTVAAAAFREGVTILGVVIGASVEIGDPLRVVALQIGERIGFGFQLGGADES